MPRAWIGAVLALLAYTSPVQSAEPLPSEFHGTWVPAGSACPAPLGISVSAQAIQFRNAKSKRSFPVEACFSCEGGSRYDGIVVWATPTGTQAELPFTAVFNAGERKGVAVVDVLSPTLQSQFPLNKVELKRCGG